MIPLSIPNLLGNELAYVSKCIKTNCVSAAGTFIDDFEGAICKFTGAKFAIACSSGTSGLHIALHLSGVKPGEEVIVPTLTFIAPVNVVKYVGAEPIFMDCDDHMNIDSLKVRDFCEKECKMTKHGLKNKKTGRIIKAIIPVHVFGTPCDMEGIMGIAKKYRIKVIEDATESLGAYYTSGTYKNKFTGTISDVGVYSFNGNKIITSGSGGMIATNSSRLAERARYLINQAKDDSVRYIHNHIGYNYRLTNLQAALGLAQLEQLDRFIKLKKTNYELYKRRLSGIYGVEVLGNPKGVSANYWFYSLIIREKEFKMSRDQVMKRLELKGVQSRPIWRLNHLQRPYHNNQAYAITKAPFFWNQVLNLPCSSSLKRGDIEYITSIIRTLNRI